VPLIHDHLNPLQKGNGTHRVESNFLPKIYKQRLSNSASVSSSKLNRYGSKVSLNKSASAASLKSAKNLRRPPRIKLLDKLQKEVSYTIEKQDKINVKVIKTSQSKKNLPPISVKYRTPVNLGDVLKMAANIAGAKINVQGRKNQFSMKRQTEATYNTIL
jgi:hypothetical protein